jgi:carbonic anhydrase/acetyltransferase-like protein (isoleucine patch superfamily)
MTQQHFISYRGITPRIASTAFIAPSADVMGNVEIGEDSGIWFHCVVRGDVEKIRIGARTNIQDGTVIHVSRNDGPTHIGNGVTVGHKALLHACTLEDDCFVGMGAIVMDNAVVESGAMVAAGALVPPGKRVLAGQIWAGNPAKYFRDLKPQETAYIPISAQNYVELAHEYRLAQKNTTI